MDSDKPGATSAWASAPSSLFPCAPRASCPCGHQHVGAFCLLQDESPSAASFADAQSLSERAAGGSRLSWLAPPGLPEALGRVVGSSLRGSGAPAPSGGPGPSSFLVGPGRLTWLSLMGAAPEDHARGSGFRGTRRKLTPPLDEAPASGQGV